MKLSIIIPVYNAETYLEKCLDSIVTQRMLKSEFEIILINDGSTDNSEIILKKYAAKYSNIQYYNQANGGEAASRNTGLLVAKGEYIGFIDNDDFIMPDSLHIILQRIYEDNLDILYCQMEKISPDGSSLGFIPDCGKDRIIQTGVEHDRRPFPATFYKKSVIGGEIYPSGILIGTDSVFNAVVQSRAQRVSYCSEPYYNYLIRPDSLSKKGQTDAAFLGFMHAIDILYSEKKEKPNDLTWNHYFENIIFVFITRIVEHNILPDLNVKRYKLLKQKLKNYQLKYLLTKLSDKYPFIGENDTKFFMHQKKNRLKSKIYKSIFSLIKIKK